MRRVQIVKPYYHSLLLINHVPVTILVTWAHKAFPYVCYVRLLTACMCQRPLLSLTVATF